MLTTLTRPINPAAPVMPQPSQSLTIMLMSGTEDGGKRATLAFVAALSAAAMERPVQVFLAGDGAIWANPDQADRVEMPGFPPLTRTEFRNTSTWAGPLLVCSTCERFCSARERARPVAAGPNCRCAAMAALLECQRDGLQPELLSAPLCQALACQIGHRVRVARSGLTYPITISRQPS